MHTNNFIEGSSSSMITDRKRKRRDLQVRFSTEPCEIIDTYSSLDYDRGGLFPDISHDDQLNNNTGNYNNNNNSNNIIFTLSFGFVTPSSSPSSSSSSSISSHHPSSSSAAAASSNLVVKKSKCNKKRPKLSIDTSNLHDGPLYFTSMTTNHQKREQQQLMNTEDDHDARITMENTEMNRRCLVAAA